VRPAASRRMSAFARRKSGLTLIELVVALTITGLAMSAGYSAFATLADRRARSSDQADAVMRAAAKRAALVSWLAGARLTIEEDAIIFKGIDGIRHTPTGEFANDDVTFLTSAETPVSNQGTIVRLHVDRGEDPTSSGLVADLVEWRGSRTQRLQLLPNVASLDARYLSSLFGKHEWLPSWISSTLLPAGVELTLGATGTDSLPGLFRLPITVSFEGGR
jgi:prepilin-type N-terminal cleavage/methylation domain-containing protein